MPAVYGVDPEAIAKAAIAWTGYGSSSYPSRNEKAVVRLFSSEMASRILPLLVLLESEFYQSDAYKSPASLAKIGEMAAQEFKTLHPELPEVIAEAFAWCYTYDFK